MKKIILTLLALTMSEVIYAASRNVILPSPISVLTAAQILVSTPTYVGQVVVCSNCTKQNGALGTLCISTETANANNAYIFAVSTQTTVTACQ